MIKHTAKTVFSAKKYKKREKASFKSIDTNVILLLAFLTIFTNMFGLALWTFYTFSLLFPISRLIIYPTNMQRPVEKLIAYLSPNSDHEIKLAITTQGFSGDNWSLNGSSKFSGGVSRWPTFLYMVSVV